MPVIQLVENHAPRAAIVLRPNASSRERGAAAELQRYLKRITKAELPILTSAGGGYPHAILLNIQSQPGALCREGFEIKTEGGNLLLLGADEDGLEHAVHAFLERFAGVRWYWPGPVGEVLPQQPSFAVDDVCLREEPDFAWRQMGPGGPLWGPQDKWEKERELGVGEEQQHEVALWERRNRLGGLRVKDGHAWVWIVPPQVYGAAHPEWFALVNGQRDNVCHDGKHANQLCTTNREMIDTFVANVRAYFGTHDVDVVSISPNDGTGFCECAQCRALDSGETMQQGGRAQPVITDRIFSFANEVADRIAASHPDKRLLLLVYSLYVVPPKRVRLRDNIIAQFCMQSAIHWDPALRARDYARLEELSHWGRELGIYEYYINGSWPDLPRLFTPLIAESIRLCHRNGFRYYAPQMGSGFAINGLNYYVAARLLWDKDSDVPALLDEFYDKAFGLAGPAMRRYYEQAERAWREAGSLPSFSEQSAYGWYLATFSPAFMAACRHALAEAAVATNSEETQARVEFARRGFRYVELTREAMEWAERLQQRGVLFFPIERAQERWQEIGQDSEVQRLADETIRAWARRRDYIESVKQGYEIAYLWIRYTDENRQFNPLRNLTILRGGEYNDQTT